MQLMNTFLALPFVFVLRPAKAMPWSVCEFINVQSQKGLFSAIVKQCVDIESGTAFCNATHDGYLCWGPTPAEEVVSQNCPPVRMSDTTKRAHRRCGPDGMWLGKYPNKKSQVGWTNYTPCFPPLVRDLLQKVSDDSDSGETQRKFDIAKITRYIEIAGFSISLIALLISLWIFMRYHTLRNQRTRIHTCLFITMVVQVIIRLIIYIDQALVRYYFDNDENPIYGIDNVTFLCESSYVLLEYSICSSFIWMLIEGIYLHSMVTGNSLRERFTYKLFYAVGWGLPAIITGVWASLTAVYYQKDNVNRCWYGYNFSPLYWILQGPCVAVISINMIFLLNIMRVLIKKLRRSATTEMFMMRKAVRAALVLLPLLGITNALNMIQPPLDGGVWGFAVWSFISHLLRSFQGFFISLLYCFLNAEVQLVLKKHYNNYKTIRAYLQRRRQETFREVGMVMLPLRSQQYEQEPKFGVKWTRPGMSTQNISETELGPSTSQDTREMAAGCAEMPRVQATIHVDSEFSEIQPKNHREPLKRWKWTRPTSSTPNISTIDGSGSSQNDPNFGHPRYVPRHHGVFVHNIPMPHNTGTIPPKGKRKVKQNPRRLLWRQRITRPTTSTPNLLRINYPSGARQEQRMAARSPVPGARARAMTSSQTQMMPGRYAGPRTRTRAMTSSQTEQSFEHYMDTHPIRLGSAGASRDHHGQQADAVEHEHQFMKGRCPK